MDIATTGIVKGRLVLNEERRRWHITAEHDVMRLLKRMFERIPAAAVGDAELVDNARARAELFWVLARWRFDVSPADTARIREGMFAEREREERVAKILAPEYVPRKFELALPLRPYQQLVADIVLEQGFLLGADEMGLGKTVEGIGMLSDPATRPAMVVCPTPLPWQWKEKIDKFLPGMNVYIAKNGKVPDLTVAARGKRVPLPDVVILSYSKLAKWAPYLATFCKSAIYDEAQAFRHEWTSPKKEDRTKVYAAGLYLRDRLKYKLGLSVGPQSTVEFFGGPFGSGWIGAIEDAYELVARVAPSRPLLGYDVIPVAHLDIHGRGLEGDQFGWKPVRCFIRHGCDKPVRVIHVGGRKLLVTVDHAVYAARGGELVPVRGDQINVGDIVPADDGCGWAVFQEPMVDVIEIARGIPQTQVTVNLAGISRAELGLTDWQWRNCHREASYGSRLPVEVFLRHRHKLPAPTMVYVGRGKAPGAPPVVKLSDWAYVLGFFLGDGWVENRQRVAFSVDPPNVQKLVAALLALPLRLRPKIQPTKSKAVEVRCTHRLFAEILVQAGIAEKCGDKSIPGPWLMTWPEVARRELLQGLLDSDGHEAIKARDTMPDRYRTTSPRLAASVHALVRSLGVLAGIHVQPPKLGGLVRGQRIEGRRPGHSVYWSRHALNGRNEGHRGARRALSWSEGHFNEARVRRNAQGTAPVYVYDLEMSGHPSFVADGLLVHNTGTPIYNRGGEVRNVLNVLVEDAVGNDEEFAREWTGGSRSTKALVLDPSALGIYLRDRLLMIRHTRKGVGIHLPKCTRNVQIIDSDPKALEAIKGSVVEFARLLLQRGLAGEDKRGAARELDWRLRQATGIAKAPFVAEVAKMILDGGEPKLLIFAWHKAVYKILGTALWDYSPVFYTGDESAQQKRAAAEAFIKGKSRVLIMSNRAGVGIDGLQEVCSCGIIAELDYSPKQHDQNITRIDRPGQTKPVMIHILMTNDGSDPVLADMLGVKQEQSDRVLDPTEDPFELGEIPEDKMKTLANDYLARHAPAVLEEVMVQNKALEEAKAEEAQARKERVRARRRKPDESRALPGHLLPAAEKVAADPEVILAVEEGLLAVQDEQECPNAPRSNGTGSAPEAPPAPAPPRQQALPGRRFSQVRRRASP